MQYVRLLLVLLLGARTFFEAVTCCRWNDVMVRPGTWLWRSEPPGQMPGAADAAVVGGGCSPAAATS
jgi:hypothetical protein